MFYYIVSEHLHSATSRANQITGDTCTRLH